MKKLPPNTTQVPLANKCDVCREKLAGYYNATWYIHICSIKCYEKFLENYNREVDEFTIVKLKPDKSDGGTDDM